MVIGIDQKGPSGEPEESGIISTREAARYLHMSPAQLRKLIHGQLAGSAPLRHARAGKLILLRKCWLEEWLNTDAELRRKKC